MQSKPTRGRPPKARPDVSIATDAERIAHQQAIGVRLKDQRELRGWSQPDLAHRTGLTATGIRQIEQGQRAPMTWTIWLLARALGCPAGWLAFGG